MTGSETEVWLRLLGKNGYLAYIYMTTEAALELAVALLENVSHRHDTDEAVESVSRLNKNSLIEALYQNGCGELFEAMVGKGADVISINERGGDDAE